MSTAPGVFFLLRRRISQGFSLPFKPDRRQTSIGDKEGRGSGEETSRDSVPCGFFPRCLTFLLPLFLAGCGAASPFSDDSIWRSARGITESAVAEGKAVVIVRGPGGAVWQSAYNPAEVFNTSERRKPLDAEHGIIVIQPGTYVLVGGRAIIDDAHLRLEGTTKEYVSSRLGRVELRNRDILEYYDVQVYMPPEVVRYRAGDGNIHRTVRSGYWTTRTLSRVVGHYVECEIVTPGKDAAGRPLWASFSVGPGEVALLREIGFSDPRPDYDRCRSTAVLGGAWSCPLESVTVMAGPPPAVGSVLGATARAGFPAGLRGRIVLKDVEFGSMFQVTDNGPPLPGDAGSGPDARVFEAGAK